MMISEVFLAAITCKGGDVIDKWMIGVSDFWFVIQNSNISHIGGENK
jgi:hypothetical protein